MDANSDSSLRERTFGHCIVTWVIRKYGQSLWQKNLDISTPEFLINGPGSQVTRWKLTLKCDFDNKSLLEKLNISIQSKPKEVNICSISKEIKQDRFDLKIGEDDREKIDFSPYDKNDSAYPMYPVKHITLRLERIESDEGPSDVLVNWKVYCLGMNGEKFPLGHDECCFFANQGDGFNIGFMHDLEKDFEHNFGAMTILCDMIVKDIYTDNYSDDNVCIDIQNLSKDLQWIFNQKSSCDAEIKVDGQRIKVHKAILCSRSSYFDDLFKNENSNVIEVPQISHFEMLNILEYLYTYDLKYVIGEPSICVYEAATLLNLEKLAAHYVPETYQICTNLDIKKLTFLWTIKSFTAEEINCRSSPVFTNDLGDSTWQIHLYPKRVGCNSKYVELAVECIEGDSDDLCVQCAVLNNGKLNFWKILPKVERANIFEDKTFISWEDVANLLNDSLTLGLKIRMCKGRESSIVYKPCTPVLLSMKTSLSDLSMNMLSLRQSKKHTDVILMAGEKTTKAHSYILSARSYLLSEIFKDGISLVSLKFSSEISDLLVEYMYGAVLNVSDIETIIDVYESAKSLLIPRLLNTCSTILQNNVTVKEASNILKLAHKYHDKYLKQAVLEFLNSNKNKFEEKVFEDLKSKTSLLSYGEVQISEDYESDEVLVYAVVKHFPNYKGKDVNSILMNGRGGMSNSVQGISSHIFVSNTNSAKNEPISFTCQFSSEITLNDEEMCVDENSLADTNKSVEGRILVEGHGKMSEYDFKSNQLKDLELKEIATV